VRILEGNPISLSETICEPFRLLAEEFGFEQLSEACAAFSKSRENCESSTDTNVSIESPKRPRVTITLKTSVRTYEVLNSFSDILRFAMGLRDADENGIVIDGVDEREGIVDKAVAVVYCNIIATFPNENKKRAFLVWVLWVIDSTLHMYNIDTAIYCLNLLNEIAPTAFDKARLLILSQCDPDSPDDFVPLPTAHGSTIVQAVLLLQRERNAKMKEAKELLQRLRETGRYSTRLLDGTLACTFSTVEQRSNADHASDNWKTMMEIKITT
jgi:hypothetical protein